MRRDVVDLLLVAATALAAGLAALMTAVGLAPTEEVFCWLKP